MLLIVLADGSAFLSFSYGSLGAAFSAQLLSPVLDRSSLIFQLFLALSIHLVNQLVPIILASPKLLISHVPPKLEIDLYQRGWGCRAAGRC